MPLRVVLDTDPGIDDSLAILLALASPEVDLAAVGVTGGNCTLEDGVRNALNVLAAAFNESAPESEHVRLRALRIITDVPQKLTAAMQRVDFDVTVTSYVTGRLAIVVLPK